MLYIFGYVSDILLSFCRDYKSRVSENKDIYTEHLPNHDFKAGAFLLPKIYMKLKNLPYININAESEYQYSYLLHILIRITGLSDNPKILKSEFIEVCKKWGVSRTQIYKIWDNGAYKNKFIKYVSDNRDYLYLTGKESFELIIEKVPFTIYNKIKGLNSLKDFLHYAFLGKNGLESEGTRTGKGLRAIAEQTNTSIRTVCNKNRKCIANFGLEKTNRYGSYNSLFIRLTNTYKSGVRIVKNKYCAVNKQVKKGIKIVSENFAPLFKALYSKIDKKLSYATSEHYQDFINPILYPKLV